MKNILVLFVLMTMNTSLARATTPQEYCRITAPSGLSLRKGPALNTKVLIVIPWETRVQVIQKSDKAETIASQKGIWVKVHWLSYSGWVFDAYLKSVSQNDPVVSFIQYCDNLDVKDIYSITKAKNYFRHTFLSRPTIQEHAFRVFRHFYIRVGDTLQQRIENDSRLTGAGYVLDVPILRKIDPDILSDEEIKKLKVELQWYEGDTTDEAAKREIDFRYFIKELVSYVKNGIQMDCGEGESFVRENYRYYMREVLQGFKGDLVSYINLLVLYHSDQTGADAGYLISWEEMRTHIVEMERFYLKDPRFFESRYELPVLIKNRLYGYLWGDDNTPLFDYSTKTLSEEIKESYRNFINHNTTSKFYPSMKKLYSLYEENNFEENDKITEYINSIIENYRDILDG